MANLASSAVTVNDSWYEGGMNGKKFRVKRLTLVLTGQGGATNKILATTLGFASKIYSCTNANSDGDDHVYCAAPSYDGTFLTLKASATDALADITDTVQITVRGD